VIFTKTSKLSCRQFLSTLAAYLQSNCARIGLAHYAQGRWTLTGWDEARRRRPTLCVTGRALYNQSDTVMYIH